LVHLITHQFGSIKANAPGKKWLLNSSKKKTTSWYMMWLCQTAI
jgi:hypothetical protein